MSFKCQLSNLKNKLLKLKNKTQNKKDIIYPNAYDELNVILNNEIKNFFPETGFWSIACFSESNECLQSHLRDNYFLAKMLQKKAKLPEVYFGKILDFISTSEQFAKQCHDYEQRIVLWQINHMLSNGEGWISDPNLGGDFSLLMPNCDLAFRKGVVDTLLAINLAPDAIEEGLEKNARLWRDYFIEKAFSNTFEPLLVCSLKDDNVVELPPIISEHKIAWIKMRKYEYYLNNKESVDLYGCVEYDMLMSDEEVTALKSFLELANKKRLEQIENYKGKNVNIRKRVPKN